MIPQVTRLTPPDTMNTTYPMRHISVAIRCRPAEVYAFASDPKNLPLWATGLGGSIRRVKGAWIADSPMGKVKIRFAKKNRFGILDHEVVLKSGATVRNPLRVIANGEGSEVVFSLIRLPGMSDKKFADDAAWVKKDLGLLKKLLEKGLQKKG